MSEIYIFAIAIMPEINIFACHAACQWFKSLLASMPVQSNALYLRYTHNASAFCLFLPVVSVVACHHASAVQCFLSLLAKPVSPVLSISASHHFISLASLPVLSIAFFFRKLFCQFCSVLSISASQHASTGNLHYPACQCRTIQCLLSLSVSVQVLCCPLSSAVYLSWPSGQ